MREKERDGEREVIKALARATVEAESGWLPPSPAGVQRAGGVSSSPSLRAAGDASPGPRQETWVPA